MYSESARVGKEYKTHQLVLWNQKLVIFDFFFLNITLVAPPLIEFTHRTFFGMVQPKIILIFVKYNNNRSLSRVCYVNSIDPWRDGNGHWLELVWMICVLHSPLLAQITNAISKIFKTFKPKPKYLLLHMSIVLFRLYIAKFMFYKFLGNC